LFTSNQNTVLGVELSIVTSWVLLDAPQNLISTGAFEVYYDGQVVFSKLATGSLPVVSPFLWDDF
jgi:hypothetical protein